MSAAFTDSGHWNCYQAATGFGRGRGSAAFAKTLCRQNEGNAKMAQIGSTNALVKTAPGGRGVSPTLRRYFTPADFKVARLGDMVLGGSGILSDGPNFEPEAIDEFGGDN